MKKILINSLISITLISLLSGCSDKEEIKDIKLNVISETIEIENNLKENIKDNTDIEEISKLEEKSIEEYKELLEEVKIKEVITEKNKDKKEEVVKILETTIKEKQEKNYYEIVEFQIENKNCPEKLNEDLFNKVVINSKFKYQDLNKKYFEMELDKNGEMIIEKKEDTNLLICFYKLIKR